MARMDIMSGTERRRRWSDEAKLRILAEADEPGARIGDVARRHDIHPGQIRLWRQSFSYADLPTVFLPVEITQEVGGCQPTTAATKPVMGHDPRFCRIGRLQDHIGNDPDSPAMAWSTDRP